MDPVETIDLIIRRAAAFAIDLIILILALSGPCLGVFIAQIDLGPGCNVFFLATGLSYFGLSETLCSGQTLGKRLFRIRVRKTSEPLVMAYESFARVSLILLLPVAANLFGKLLVVFHFISRSGSIIPFFLLIASLAVWPISAILGQGRVAIHDLLWHTEVIHVRNNGKLFPRKVGREYPWIVLFTTLLISIACAKLIFTPVLSSCEGFFERFNATEKSELMRLADSAQDLSLRIENGPEFISSDGQVLFWKWNSDIWKKWSVKRSVLLLPDDIMEGHLRFNVYVQYIIPVTRRGFSSSMFQEAAALELFGKAMRPDLFMTIEFVHKSSISIFCQTKKKRCLGFLYRDMQAEESQYYLIILEPDIATEIFLGLEL